MSVEVLEDGDCSIGCFNRFADEDDALGLELMVIPMKIVGAEEEEDPPAADPLGFYPTQPS